MSLVAFSVLSLYQNCSGQFQVMNQSDRSISSPVSCELPRGGILADGDAVLGYRNPSVDYGEFCESKLLACEAGVLSPRDYQYQSCEIRQPSSCSLPWGGLIAHGMSVTAYEKPGVPREWFNNITSSSRRYLWAEGRSIGYDSILINSLGLRYRLHF